MTRKAMIKVLEYKADHIKTKINPNFFREVAKALSQQYCEDCISREQALKALNYDIKYYVFKQGVSEYMDDIARLLDTVYEIQAGNIKELPPVCFKTKVGYWIYDKRIENWKCSECGCSPKTIGYVGRVEFMREHFKFCNHCGAKMADAIMEEK